MKPLILISNDDGVSAKGIHALAEVASRFADVVVAAPDGSYSGKSHAITVLDELRVRRVDDFSGALAAYAIKGTPVDCVKLAFHGLVPRRPDLIISGINHGSNASVSVHYSGTIGAAREGALLGITSCGFSLDSYDDDADFSQAQVVADRVISALLSGELASARFYNVNVPLGVVRGARLCRMALAHWVERPIRFSPPFGPDDIYWLDGSFVNDNPDDSDTDVALLANGFATITPLLLDATDYEALAGSSVFNL